MPTLSEIRLHPALNTVLAPLVGDKTLGHPEEGMWLEKGRLRLEMEDLGEGWSGDYDEDDPSDTPLLRFTFYAINPASDSADPIAGQVRLDQLDECSYCTGIPANAPWALRLACACEIFDEVFDKLSLPVDPSEEIDPATGRDARRVCERLSNLSIEGHDDLLATLQSVELDEATPVSVAPPLRPRI